MSPLFYEAIRDGDLVPKRDVSAHSKGSAPQGG